MKISNYFQSLIEEIKKKISSYEYFFEFEVMEKKTTLKLFTKNNMVFGYNPNDQKLLWK